MYINCLICTGSCFPPMLQNRAVVFRVMDRNDIKSRAAQTTKVCDLILYKKYISNLVYNLR